MKIKQEETVINDSKYLLTLHHVGRNEGREEGCFSVL